MDKKNMGAEKVREGAAKKSGKQKNEKRAQGKKGSLRKLERGRHFVSVFTSFRHW
jgi:hypothetical protein